uniref:Uncharacterized protein n=1 Tax=Meleagris gallopavo TaxID=9103 RepID=A0A803XND8_MELGA
MPRNLTFSELRFMVPRRLPILFVLCLACLWSCTVFTITFSCPPIFVFLAPFSWPNDPLALCCHIHVGIQFWRSLPYCLGRHPWHFLPCSLGPCLCLGIPCPPVLWQHLGRGAALRAQLGAVWLWSGAEPVCLVLW